MHASGVPFSDPSGVRLRRWMGVTEDEFYDVNRIAIVPMGFCFPGQDAKGGDLPPRRECAPHWRGQLMAALPALELILLVGRHAQFWHLPKRATEGGLAATIRAVVDAPRPAAGPRLLALPHPSWRNTAWLQKNSWFEAEVLPVVRAELRRCIDG